MSYRISCGPSRSCAPEEKSHSGGPPTCPSAEEMAVSSASKVPPRGAASTKILLPSCEGAFTTLSASMHSTSKGSDRGLSTNCWRRGSRSITMNSLHSRREIFSHLKALRGYRQKKLSTRYRKHARSISRGSSLDSQY